MAPPGVPGPLWGAGSEHQPGRPPPLPLWCPHLVAGVGTAPTHWGVGGIEGVERAHSKAFDIISVCFLVEKWA